MSDRIVRAVVVGGGITGLAAAHRLHELARREGRSIRVQLLEASDRIGGNIRTERHGESLLEGGPDQFVVHKPAALALCRRLGLEGRLVEIDARQTATHVVDGGRPVRLPDGLTMMGPTRLAPLARTPLLGWRGKLRAAWEPFVSARPEEVEDESVESFAVRRFGREFHDRVLEPIVGGIFTADTRRLSLEMTIRPLLDIEKRHGSVTVGVRERQRRSAMESDRGARPAGCVTLRDGLGRLVEALTATLPADELHLGCSVSAIVRAESGEGWRVVTDDGRSPSCDVVVIACPAHRATHLLRWAPEVAADLAALEYASCATVNLIYPASAFERPPESFGFFVGAREGLPILACSHVSVKFPERVAADRVLLRAFLGGARTPQAIDGNDETIAKRAHETLTPLLGLGAAPALSRVQRFPQSMPQFHVGYRRRMDALVQRLQQIEGIELAGGVMGAIGLPDCIASGESAAQRAWLSGRQARKAQRIVSGGC